MIKFDYIFDNVTIKIPIDLICKIYDDEDFFGVIIYNQDGQFNINHNKEANWNRIFINYSDNSWKDLPFNEGTYSFLPEGIEIVSNK